MKWNNIKKFWKKYGFIIILIVSILTLIIYWIFNTDKNSGTYFNKNQVLPLLSSSLTKRKKRKGPKESEGERESRRVLEQLFNRPFPNVRPAFLKNEKTGKNLEIDCFNKELGIAVEIQGIQHYKYCPWFHRNQQDFIDQQSRDSMKKRICKDNGIIFIEIPYTVKPGDIRQFIIFELRKYGGYNFLF